MAKILVVDDEPDIVRFVVKILEKRGHQVITAAEGPEAIEIASREQPDAIVLDLNLPRMDGFEACRRLKAEPLTKKIPVVMMSAAYVKLGDVERGESAGADAYVVKPFLREVLVHNVERLLPGEASTGAPVA